VSTIKPDVWVIKFAQRVMGRRLLEKALVALFHEIAPWVGESLTTWVEEVVLRWITALRELVG
jgi:hypothetical protein